MTQGVYQRCHQHGCKKKALRHGLCSLHHGGEKSKPKLRVGDKVPKPKPQLDNLENLIRRIVKEEMETYMSNDPF